MKVSAGILVHNAERHRRLDLLQDCIWSLQEADAVMAVDNGSADSTGGWLDLRCGNGYLARVEHFPAGGVTTIGAGSNRVADMLADWDPDGIHVRSDDDVFWRPGWRPRLEAFWSEAPDDIWIAGCHLEADYPWNTVEYRVEYGRQQALIRQSTGSGTWSWRAPHVDNIFPLPDTDNGWSDVPGCARVWLAGGRVAQLDLAEHRGAGQSTWGNQSDGDHEKPLDLEALGWR